MNHLIQEAKRLGIRIFSGDLPATENARYFHSHRAIILRRSMSDPEACRALATALGQAFVIDSSGHSTDQNAAELRAVTLLLTSYAVKSRVSATPISGGIPIVCDPRDCVSPGVSLLTKVRHSRRVAVFATTLTSILFTFSGGSMLAVGV